MILPIEETDEVAVVDDDLFSILSRYRWRIKQGIVTSRGTAKKRKYLLRFVATLRRMPSRPYLPKDGDRFNATTANLVAANSVADEPKTWKTADVIRRMRAKA